MANDRVLELRRAACAIAQEFRSSIDGGRREAWAPILSEIERRCPGFTTQQYSDALDYGFRMQDNKEDVLQSEACELAVEYRDGKLPHIIDSSLDTQVRFRSELKKRCPGFTTQQYEDAMAYGFKATR